MGPASSALRATAFPAPREDRLPGLGRRIRPNDRRVLSSFLTLLPERAHNLVISPFQAAQIPGERCAELLGLARPNRNHDGVGDLVRSRVQRPGHCFAPRLGARLREGGDQAARPGCMRPGGLDRTQASR